MGRKPKRIIIVEAITSPRPTPTPTSTGVPEGRGPRAEAACWQLAPMAPSKQAGNTHFPHSGLLFSTFYFMYTKFNQKPVDKGAWESGLQGSDSLIMEQGEGRE